MHDVIKKNKITKNYVHEKNVGTWNGKQYYD